MRRFSNLLPSTFGIIWHISIPQKELYSRNIRVRALHEHRARRPNALINEDHEKIVLVAKENAQPLTALRHASAST
jgi:hypothetical protein